MIAASFTRVAGILCVVGAISIFMTQNMVVKLLSDDYPLHELMLIRSSVAILVLTIVFLPFEGGFNALRTQKLTAHLLRGFGIVVANLAYFMGLASMSLAETQSIFFVAPLLITMFSAWFLKEEVGVRRWSAVIVGLVGVLIIMRPGSDLFQFSSTLPLIGALAYALVNVSTRSVGKTEKATTMAIYVQVTFVIICSMVGLTLGDGRYVNGSPSVDFLLRPWVAPSVGDFLLIAGLGCSTAVGVYLLFQGYRLADASLVAPFEYIGIPLSIFWGIIVFQDFPDTAVWIGIGLIVAAGLYTIYREAGKRKQRPVLANSREKNS